MSLFWHLLTVIVPGVVLLREIFSVVLMRRLMREQWRLRAPGSLEEYRAWLRKTPADRKRALSLALDRLRATDAHLEQIRSAETLDQLERLAGVP